VKQNITINLEQDLVRKASNLAEERGRTLDELVADELERLVADADYEGAKTQALAALDRGLHLGGKPPPREALHER
jgi:predicted transcriptional regulator